MKARVIVVLLVAASSLAARSAGAAPVVASEAGSSPWIVSETAAPELSMDALAALPHVDAAAWAEPVASLAQEPAQTAPTPRAVAYEYSDGYRVRAKIHRLASYATLPLFVSQYVVGEKLFDGDTGLKGAHGALAFGVGALFGVNSVTGLWNLIESRKDPNHRKRRLFHGLVMLGCDAGFVVTGLVAPDDDEGGGSSNGRRSLHRKVALTSMGIAGANYLFMLLTNR